jgi:hypothetical protein
MAEHTPQKLDGKDKRSESFGPIAFTRHVKDDGRALLLYTRRHENGEGDDTDGDKGAGEGAAAGRRS